MKYIFTLVFVLGFLNVNAKRHYVNINATGLNNGTSWANAFTDLSQPLCDFPGDTFWVANGTYVAQKIVESWAYHVIDSTALYGGFDGSETLLSQRNYSAFNTIIAGSNNTNHTTTISIQNTSNKPARIDGFRITNISGWGTQKATRGIDIGGAFDLANCLITNNWSDLGPVLVGTPAPVNITNCQFVTNGITPVGSAPAKASTINVTGGNSLVVTDCIFKNNEGVLGGAVNIAPGRAAIFNRCVFYGNTARYAGGAIYDTTSATLRVFNSLFVGNKSIKGAAHYSFDSVNSKHTFIHCTFAHNLATQPGSKNYTLWLNGVRDTLLNCILWGDSSGTGAEIPQMPPTWKAGCFFGRNVIEGATPIINTTFVYDPLFKAPGTAASAPFGATTNYDYHLSEYSDAIDSADNLPLPAPFNFELGGSTRKQGAAPDLGAYEWKGCNWVNVFITPSGPTAFCKPGSVQLTASANPSYNHVYQWNGGTQTGLTITATTTGRNKVIVVDSTGCRSAAAVMIASVDTPKPVITRTGNTLSVPPIYSACQWYLGGVLIGGATSNSYTATATGEYTVWVTENPIAKCRGVSAPFTVSSLSVATASAAARLSVFPNPAKGQLNIKLDAPGGVEKLQLSLRNMTGQKLFSEELRQTKAGFEHVIDVSRLAAGVYFLVVDADGFQWTKKVAIAE